MMLNYFLYSNQKFKFTIDSAVLDASVTFVFPNLTW